MTLGEIARAVNGEIEGDPDIVIEGVREIEEATPHDIVFAFDRHHALAASRSQAAAAVLKRGYSVPGKPVVIVDNPRLAMAIILDHFRPPLSAPHGIDPTAHIGEGAKIAQDASVGAYAVIESGATIGAGCIIFPGAYIGRDVVIGDGTVIFPNVCIGERVRVGKRTIIHAGAVIGADGFGFVWDGNINRKIPQIGTVVIGNDVEIGANACIDRATIGATIIEDGTKIDNLVQIGHNVKVGPHVIIVGQTGIGGSCVIEERAILAGQVGVVDHVSIGGGATVAARSFVTSRVPPEEMVSGSPARPHREELESEVAIRRLPRMIQSLRALEEIVSDLQKRIEQLENSLSK